MRACTPQVLGYNGLYEDESDTLTMEQAMP